VRYIDPDGRASLDSDEKVIHANLEDIDDLNEAANMLSYLQNDGYTVQATNKNGYGFGFSNYVDMLRFMESIEPTNADWGTVGDIFTYTSLAADAAGVVSLFICPPAALALFGASAKLDMMAAGAYTADGNIQGAALSATSAFIGLRLKMPGFNVNAARFLRPGKTIFMGTQKAIQMLVGGSFVSPLYYSIGLILDAKKKRK
jgi:hypothetical protein